MRFLFSLFFLGCVGFALGNFASRNLVWSNDDLGPQGQSLVQENFEPLEILYASPSGQLIIVNAGIEEFYRNQQAYILAPRNEESEISPENMDLVARASLLRIRDNRSLWRLEFGEEQESAVVEGNKVYLYTTENSILRGRKLKYKIRNRVIYEDQRFLDNVPKKYYEGDLAFLKKFDHEFRLQHTHENPNRTKAYDYEMVEIGYWDKEKNLSRVIKIPKLFYKSSTAPSFSTDRANRILKLSLVNTIQKNQDEKVEAELRKRFPQVDFEDPRWSQEYSDEELGFMVSQMGRIRESLRRKTTYDSNHIMQLGIGVGGDVVDKQTREDPINELEWTPSYLFHFELFLFKNSPILKRWTIGLDYRQGEKGLSNSNKNIQMSDNLYQFRFRYYPWDSYFTTQKFVPYLEAGFLMGTALGSTSAGEREYKVNEWPVLGMGARFNPIPRMSLVISLSYQNIKYDARPGSSTTEAALSDRLEGKDIQMGASLGFFL